MVYTIGLFISSLRLNSNTLPFLYISRNRKRLNIRFRYSMMEESRAEAFGEAIYRLARNKDLRKDLVEKGKEQLKTYDNYEERARKLIEIVEKECRK